MRSCAQILGAVLVVLGVSPIVSSSVVSAQQPPAADEALLSAAREIMVASHYAALITLTPSGAPRARTMDPFEPDSAMVVWMGTRRGTRKVEDIRRDPRVTLYYQAPDGSGYVTIEGTARLVDDADQKARRWKDEWARFYADRDADYLLIAVEPSRLEVVNYRQGVMGDSATWRVPAIEPVVH